MTGLQDVSGAPAGGTVAFTLGLLGGASILPGLIHRSAIGLRWLRFTP